jgi:hypothetical protein
MGLEQGTQEGARRFVIRRIQAQRQVLRFLIIVLINIIAFLYVTKLSQVAQHWAS